MKLSSKADFTLEWSVPKFKAEPQLEAGESFIEVYVVIDATNGMRSVGKHDYTLSGQPCLAMGEGDGAYNPENREYVVTAKQKLKTVKLLFKGSKANAPFTLSYNYDEIDGFDPAITTVQLDLRTAPKPAVMEEIKPKKASKKAPKKASKKASKKTQKKKPRIPQEEW